jgi:hypothetical protein
MKIKIKIMLYIALQITCLNMYTMSTQLTKKLSGLWQTFKNTYFVFKDVQKSSLDNVSKGVFKMPSNTSELKRLINHQQNSDLLIISRIWILFTQ